MKTINLAVLGIIVLSFIIGICSYSQMPAIMASHWNENGDINGYMPKFWALFLMPIISAGLYLMFIFIPKIDPLKSNIEKFRKYYDLFVLVLMIFLFYIYLLTIAVNLGYRFNMTFMILPAIGLLFFYLGFIMPKLERNWFMGIRTPWTLSNDLVWERTHKLGAVLFKILGIIFFFSVFLPSRYMIGAIIVPIFAMIIILFLYSYLEYRKLKDFY